MRMIAVATLVVAGLMAMDAAAVAQDASLAGATPRDGGVFILTAGTALAVANAHLMVAGKEPIYCAPEGSLGSQEALWGLVNEHLTGPHDAEVIIMVLVEALTETYPCS